MKKIALLTASFSFTAALAAATVWAKVPAAAPLARAGAVTADAAEVATYARKNFSRKLADLTLEQKRSVVVKFIVRKALARDAETAGLQKDPLVEKSLLQWKVQNYPRAYWAREDAKVRVGDKELRAHVNPQEDFLLSAIILGLDEEGKAAANEIYGLLTLGGDFVQLAKERSRGLSANAGGDFGWNTIPNKYVEEKEAEIIRRTKPGTYTEPVETQVGWVIYWVRGRKSADEVFKERKDKVNAELLPAKVQEMHEKKMKELRGKASISYPAEKAIPGAGAPAAVVDGFAIFADALSSEEAQHDFAFRNVSTTKERLEKFIDAFLLVREAEKTGIDKDPELQREFAQERMEVLAQVYLRAQTDVRITLSDADLRAEYRRFYVPEVYLLQLLAVDDRARAEEAYRKIKGGTEDFDAVAAEYCEGQLGKNKGRMAPGPIVDYAPEVRKAIEGLADGGMTGVLANGDAGWIIVKRLGKQTVEVPPFEQVAAAIRTKLMVRRRTDFLKDYIEKYRKKLQIAVDDEQLKKL